MADKTIHLPTIVLKPHRKQLRAKRKWRPIWRPRSLESVQLTSSTSTSSFVSWGDSLETIVPPRANRADWAAWRMYAQFVKAAWRITRADVAKQMYRAEASDLQAKSAMVQVVEMKSQLKADILRMREHVKGIKGASERVEGLERRREALQREYEELLDNVESLGGQLADLTTSVSSEKKERDDYQVKHDALTQSLVNCNRLCVQLKEELTTLETTDRQISSDVQRANIQFDSAQKQLRDVETTNEETERSLEDSKLRVGKTVEAIEAAEKETLLLSSEIEIVKEGGKSLQKELVELRNSVITRNVTIAELNARTATALQDMDVFKAQLKSYETTFWGRLRFNSFLRNVIRWPTF